MNDDERVQELASWLEGIRGRCEHVLTHDPACYWPRDYLLLVLREVRDAAADALAEVAEGDKEVA